MSPFEIAPKWLFCLAAAGVAAVAADTPPPLKIHQHQLANGLKVVLAEDKSRPVTNLQVWYHVGSRNEKTGRTGFAHLFEHMMFRGSNNVEAEEHMRLVRESGGVVNAYTSFDVTVYWETFPSNYLERMLWLEADRMASLKVTEANFIKEREVVKEERRLRFENPPYGRLLEDVLENLYTTYPYRTAPIGSMADLNKATIEDVREFHSTYYLPNNATVVLVGDFDTKEALALVEKHFAPIPKGKPIPPVTATQAEREKPKVVDLKYPNAPLPAVIMAYLLPPMGHPDQYPLEVAASILSDGQSSRIYRKLVYESELAAAATGQGLFLEGPSLFFGYGIANQGKSIDDISKGLEAIFAELASKPPSEEEMTKAKNQIIAGFITGREGVQSKADFLGKMSVQLNDPELYNKELEKYRKVTAADVQRVIAKYLAPDHQVKLVVMPGGKAVEGGE